MRDERERRLTLDTAVVSHANKWTRPCMAWCNCLHSSAIYIVTYLLFPFQHITDCPLRSIVVPVLNEPII